MKYDLSILIPARQEKFLKRTVEDILQNLEGNTEVVVVLDGALSDPPLLQHERVTVIYHPESIGQRAACNEAAKIASGKYVMKCDAHCSFDKGFDVKMLAEMHDDWTMVPLMKNLHVFDWVCPDGHRRYQGPSGVCTECGKPTEQQMMWIAKDSPKSVSYCFDSEPHFQYFGDYAKRPEGQGDITETMSLQGSCWMMTKEKYFELGVCDESFGSWGSQGIEVACKTWLSGGTVMCNRKTWYAHCFRTQGEDFGFPYPQSGSQIDHAKKCVRELFFDNRWPKQTRPLSWLVERFWPVPGWNEEDLKKLQAWPLPSIGTIYYTDNMLDPVIMQACQKQLKDALRGEIVSCSLEHLDFGRNIILPLQRGVLTMFKQILAALEASTADIVFFCEHDVLYHPSHFDFRPMKKDVYYYNMNSWILRASDGYAVYYDHKSLSGLCAYRDLLIRHYKERIRRVEQEGFSRKMGFEPGTHGRAERVDDFPAEGWRSEKPNIDIRHGGNLTNARWKPEDFRDQRNCRNWKEAKIVPGWCNLRSLIEVSNTSSI